MLERSESSHPPALPCLLGTCIDSQCATARDLHAMSWIDYRQGGGCCMACQSRAHAAPFHTWWQGCALCCSHPLPAAAAPPAAARPLQVSCFRRHDGTLSRSHDSRFEAGHFPVQQRNQEYGPNAFTQLFGVRCSRCRICCNILAVNPLYCTQQRSQQRQRGAGPSQRAGELREKQPAERAVISVRSGCIPYASSL